MQNRQKVIIFIVMTLVLLSFLVLLIFFQKKGVPVKPFSASENIKAMPRNYNLEESNEEKGFQKTTEQPKPQLTNNQTGQEGGTISPKEEVEVGAETKKPETTPDPELEKKIFETLYPKSYRDHLSFFQDILVDEKFISASKRASFQNEDEIFGFVRKGIEYMRDNNMLAQSDAEKFLNQGLSEWRQLNQKEAEMLREGKLPLRTSSSIKPFKMPAVSSCNSSPFSVFSDLIKKLIWGNTARAFVCTPIECWQLGAGVGPLPGVNLWAPCCCCFCGKAPCGCLNAVCVGRNAIWDPMTGICGCDI